MTSASVDAASGESVRSVSIREVRPSEILHCKDFCSFFVHASGGAIPATTGRRPRVDFVHAEIAEEARRRGGLC